MSVIAKAPPLAVVRPDWVDSYGHMNMGYYLVIFDMVTDQLWPSLGLGAPLHALGMGTFAAETWVNYVQEVREGMPLAGRSEVLGYDGKRLLARHELVHAEEGWVAAENEVLYLCIDLNVRRVTTWPEQVQAIFASRATGRPGQRLAIRRRGA